MAAAASAMRPVAAMPPASDAPAISTDSSAADAVADAHGGRGHQQCDEADAEGHQQHRDADDEHGRHGDPAPALDVHHAAGGIEEQHLDASGDPVDQRGHGGREHQVIRPQRDHRLTRGAHRADQHHAQSQREEDAAMVGEDGLERDRRGRGLAGGMRGVDQVRQSRADGGGGQHARDAHGEGGRQAEGVHRGGGEEGADEHADAHHAAQRGERAGAIDDGHGLGEVALAGEVVDGLDMPTMKQPAAKGTRPWLRTLSAMPSALQMPAATMAQRSPQRMVMMDAGMFVEQRAQADQRDHEGGHRDRGAEVARHQRDDGQDGALAEAEEQRRAEGGDGDLAEGERRRGRGVRRV
ncbi:hypothetical protein Ddc_22384 [Ditylenchus destructor]|nr:hypothetical protein Ddc_22384 [Ditylenchus destructor]